MPSTRVFEWHNHSQIFTDWFRSRQINDAFADFTLWCGREKIRCHRFILAAASPYFNDMFQNGYIRESFTLPDMTHDDIIDVLRVIYDGSVTLKDDRLEVFLRAGRIFQIDMKNIQTQITDSDSTKEDTEEGMFQIRGGSVFVIFFVEYKLLSASDGQINDTTEAEDDDRIIDWCVKDIQKQSFNTIASALGLSTKGEKVAMSNGSRNGNGMFDD